MRTDGNRIARSAWAQPAGGRRGAARAFTLIELLVVMAISVILLGLIFGPLVQGFDLLRAARVQVQAFDTARTLMARIQQDLSEGAFVFDYGDSASNPGGSAVNLWLPGSSTPVTLPYAMVDIVPAAHLADLQPYSPANVDPTTGLPINRGPAAVPAVPGRAMIRYWLGLRDNTTTGGSSTVFSGQPVKPYRNWLEDPHRIPQNQDNRVILYRAVVSPYLPTGELDTRLFHRKSTNPSDPDYNVPVLYDPNFYYDDAEAVAPNASTGAAYPGAVATHGNVRYSDNWRAVAHAMVPTERADMVRADHFPDGTVNYATAEPLINFQPTQVSGDVAAAGAAGDPGNEAPGAPPVTFRGAHGSWNTPFNVYVYRSSSPDINPLSQNPLTYFYWDGRQTDNVQFKTATFSGGSWSVTQVDTGWNPVSKTLPGSIPSQFLMFTADPARGAVAFGVDLAGTASTFDPSVANAGSVISGYTYRMVSLRDPSQSPLAALQNANARIVAGSEVVTGPDMRSGPNYGNAITYTRVPRRNDPMSIGPNDYMINYADLGTNPTSPLLQSGTIIFDSQPDSSGVKNSLPTLDQTGASAQISVTYRVQNNLANDVVKADYMTRETMKFSLSIRLYELGSGSAQQVNLAQTVQVQNLQR